MNERRPESGVLALAVRQKVVNLLKLAVKTGVAGGVDPGGVKFYQALQMEGVYEGRSKIPTAGFLADVGEWCKTTAWVRVKLKVSEGVRMSFVTCLAREMFCLKHCTVFTLK